MNRRSFLGGVAAGWLLDTALPPPPRVQGRIVGAAHRVGHLLRDGGAAAGTLDEERADVVVVGAGVSGLSAAWRLAPLGLDVVVADLEPFVGGTSTYGDEGAVAHPWGAHYLPVPNPEARAALRLLAEMGTVTGWDAAGRPRFDPRVLCHAPQERIFYRGAWHPGLVPTDALDPADLEELARFSEEEHALTARVGRDGRAAFQSPLALSSRDPELLALDRMTMAEWLAQRGYRSPFLHWYVRYATLDDYGADPDQVSAWAGLHYFCARKLRAPELEGSHYLVWPEGNGRLVAELVRRARPRVFTSTLALSVRPEQAGVAVELLDTSGGRRRLVRARAVVLAIPGFVARRVLPESATRLPARITSPWVVANLHVKMPLDPDLPWDSVLHEAEGLGYVDAQHQLTRPTDRTVLTYFRAWGGADVAGARGALLAASWDELATAILADLRPAHPHLRDAIDRLDVMVWGHAMPRPSPGFLGDPPFEAPVLLADRVAWAHVDQGGIALFEEAQARGVRAAEALAGPLGVDLGETWL